MNFIESKKDFFLQTFPNYKINEHNKIAYFSNVDEEYFILQNGVGLRDISYKSIYKLQGKDVLDFIHRISTNSVKQLVAGEKSNTLFLNDKGKIIDRTMLLSFGDFYFLIGSEYHKNKLVRWLDRFIINEDIVISDQNSNYCVFEILGPQSESYLTMICGNDLDKLSPRNFITIVYENVEFQLLKFSEPNGLVKFWIISDSKNYESIIQIFLNQKSVFDFGMVGNEAYEIFRIENMIPKAPNELTDDFNPHDLNLVHEIDFKKGCYIGQEVIARQDTYNKVQFSLSKIFIDENNFTIPFESVENDQLIYRIASIAKSPKYDKYIGLCLLRKSYFNGTQSFTIDVQGRKINCTLV